MKAIFLCAILFASTARTANAMQTVQTDAEKLLAVQTENQKLRDDLAAAQKRIKELEGASLKTTTPTPRASTPLDPTTDLMGNPIAVLDFFQKKFSEDMNQNRVPLPQETDTESTRKSYLGKAKGWLDMINRSKYQIVWRGRITEMNTIGNSNKEVQFQCVSVDNKNNFGRPVALTISNSNAPQLGATLPASNVIWTLNATIEPMLNLDPTMLEPNTFDNPPLIGPCISFRFKITSPRLFFEKSSAVSAPTK